MTAPHVGMWEGRRHPGGEDGGLLSGPPTWSVKEVGWALLPVPIASAPSRGQAALQGRGKCPYLFICHFVEV